MESNPVEKSTEKSGEKANYKRRLGRRTSDWLIPVVMWTVALSAILAARHYYQRAMDAESLNETLQHQVQLFERTPKAPAKAPVKKRNP